MALYRKGIYKHSFLKVRFLRNMLITSVLLATLLPAVSVYHAYPAYTKVLLDSTKDDAVRTANLLATTLLTANSDLQPSLGGQSSFAAIRMTWPMLGLTKVKIFSKNGRVTFSTDPKDIGKINHAPYFFDVVNNRREHTRFARQHSKSLEGEKMPRDVVETYVPIIKGNQCLGALEIYYDVTARRAQLERLLRGYASATVVLALGLLGGVIAILRREHQGIGHRIRAERELKMAHAELRQIFETTADGMRVVDKNFNVLRVNKAFAKLSGTTVAEALGRKCYEGFPCAICHTPSCPLNKVLGGEDHVEFEIDKTRSDGTTVPCVVSATPFRGADGILVGIVEDIRDIGERKRAEEEKFKLGAQLRQAQKMESIGTLAGGIAHDFNNILTPIIAHSEMALLDLEAGTRSVSVVQSRIKEVLNAGHRAKDLIYQILTFSRQTDGRAVPTKVSLIIKEAMRLLRASLPATISMKTNLAASSDMVLADPTQIHQVLMNLCTNSAHAMKEKGGLLEVSLVNATFDNSDEAAHLSLKPGSYVQITVHDTGHGIAPDLVNRIFDPFFTTKARDEGTGMGLSVVHGIVKNYGGAIRVDSSPQNGATFDVYLPVSTPDLRQTETTFPAPLPGGNERILLIDDEEAIRNAVPEILNRLGYDVVIKSCGIEALDTFRASKNEFDLIITDQTMPNITGFELAQEVMRIRPDIPVILCTGFSDSLSKETALSVGIRAYIAKPIAMIEIANTIRDVLDQA